MCFRRQRAQLTANPAHFPQYFCNTFRRVFTSKFLFPFPWSYFFLRLLHMYEICLLLPGSQQSRLWFAIPLIPHLSLRILQPQPCTQWMNDFGWWRGSSEKTRCCFIWKGASVWAMSQPWGHTLIALGSWCVSSDCSEPRWPPEGAGGTSWGIRRPDLCWLCDPWRSDGGSKDSFPRFMLKYDPSVLSVCLFFNEL